MGNSVMKSSNACIFSKETLEKTAFTIGLAKSVLVVHSTENVLQTRRLRSMKSPTNKMSPPVIGGTQLENILICFESLLQNTESFNENISNDKYGCHNFLLAS
jgi:hypothetical protein